MTQVRNIDTANLGELEMSVLHHVWENGPTDVKAAYEVLGRPRGITLNTVQSAFKRLWEKNLLSREKQSHAYIYAPAVSRSELTEQMVGTLITQLTGDEFGAAIEAFVNLAERAGDDTLDAMERLIAARRDAEKD